MIFAGLDNQGPNGQVGHHLPLQASNAASAFLCHREAHRTAAPPQRLRLRLFFIIAKHTEQQLHLKDCGFGFSLSSRSTSNSSSTSNISIFSSQRHQDRLPDDLQEDAPSRPKLHVYPKDKYNCCFRDLPGQLRCRCTFRLMK